MNDELKKKREELKQKLSHDAQREDKKGFLAALDFQKVKYEIFWDDDKTARDELSKFPITSYGVLDLAVLQDIAEVKVNQFDELIKDKNLDNSEVFVSWAFGPSLDLRTSFEGVLNNIALLTKTSDDFFVVCPRDNWAIMFRHDNKILFGRLVA